MTSRCARSAESWGMQVRLIKHEAVPQCGSYEVRFPDGRPSRYFYWDDVASRRLRPDMLTGEQALEQARDFARAASNEKQLRPHLKLKRQKMEPAFVYPQSTERFGSSPGHPARPDAYLRNAIGPPIFRPCAAKS